MAILRTVAALVVLAYCTVADACLPAFTHTEYFGKTEFLSEDVDKKIRDDVERNHYTVIERRIGTLFYPIIKNGDSIYLDREVIATKSDSFRYFGEGYYRVNGDLFYVGKRIGSAPRNGSVVVYTLNRNSSPPENPPPNQMVCLSAAHAAVLETSDGLRFENLVSDN